MLNVHLMHIMIPAQCVRIPHLGDIFIVLAGI